MQGQNRQTVALESNFHDSNPNYQNPRVDRQQYTGNYRRRSNSTPHSNSTSAYNYSNDSTISSGNNQQGDSHDFDTHANRRVEFNEEGRKSSIRTSEYYFNENDAHNDNDTDNLSTDTGDNRSSFVSSDQITSHSDNISTTPLKSIISAPSTKAPSVLSTDHNQDNNSYVASTVETSIAPSIHTTGHNNYLLYPGNASLQSSNNPNFNLSVNQGNDRDSTRERDSESIVTLASSSRRTRRRSLDTNCSTAGIPPASIMERLSLNPTAANGSSAAVSAHNSNELPETTSD